MFGIMMEQKIYGVHVIIIYKALLQMNACAVVLQHCLKKIVHGKERLAVKGEEQLYIYHVQRTSVQHFRTYFE